jgi:hypothetical protein
MTFILWREGLAALIFGTLTKNQKKIAFNAIEKLKNGDRLTADEVSMLIANGKFSRAKPILPFSKFITA